MSECESNYLFISVFVFVFLLTTFFLQFTSRCGVRLHMEWDTPAF